MTKKTEPAYKINATIALYAERCKEAFEEQAAESPIEGSGAFSRVNVTYVHSILARYDDLAYMVAVTKRIEQIKAHVHAMGEVSTWYVVAGAVPAGSAERVVMPADEATK